MINLEVETLISVKQAAELAPGGKVSTDTIYDWRNKGIARRDGTRVYLECFQRGARVFTTREALNRFMVACNADVRVTTPAPVVIAPGEMSPERKELLAMGVGTDPNAPSKRRRKPRVPSAAGMH